MSDYSYINAFSDKHILKQVGEFIRQTRIRNNMTQDDLARRAAVSRSTLSLIERGDNISLLNLVKILRMLDALYVFKAFETSEEISPLMLAQKLKTRRKRASRPRNSPNTQNSEEW